jgi:hypothetical protein
MNRQSSAAHFVKKDSNHFAQLHCWRNREAHSVKHLLEMFDFKNNTFQLFGIITVLRFHFKVMVRRAAVLLNTHTPVVVTTCSILRLGVLS